MEAEVRRNCEVIKHDRCIDECQPVR
jgi:hypothetical protein